MQTYSLFDAPLRVSGVPDFPQNKTLQRLPDDLLQQLPHLRQLAMRCPGARVAFTTDSPTFTVKVTLASMTVDIGMGIYAAQSAHVMVGSWPRYRHLGVVNPPDYNTLTFEKTFTKSDRPEQVTVYFPRNQQVTSMEISVEDGASVTAPTPFRHTKPVVFYGSSITEGGCACNASNAYPAILSRWLDFDFYNMGFSSNAKGEPIMAEYLSTLDMGAFVYDYDFNAPNPDYLAQTHKPFFDIIRKSHPNIPILMLSHPGYYHTEKKRARRDIIKATFDAARADGDMNVYYLDGEVLLGTDGLELCLVDGTHPNDLGFYRMAQTIRPVIEQFLHQLR